MTNQGKYLRGLAYTTRLSVRVDNLITAEISHSNPDSIVWLFSLIEKEWAPRCQAA